jgi:hypothetical protein
MGHLRPATARFLDANLARHEADMVFKARDVDGVHVHGFVIEHKSDLRGYTVFQPLRYVVRVLERWGSEQGGEARRGAHP